MSALNLLMKPRDWVEVCWFIASLGNPEGDSPITFGMISFINIVRA